MSKFRLLVPITELGQGVMVVNDVHDQMVSWFHAVAARGGKLSANRVFASCAQQQPLRDKYVAYLAAKAAWEQGGRKGPAPAQVAAANKPGRSNHQGGRAIDANTKNVFPNDPADKQVDLLWETGARFGFTPIIKSPDESASERWHFDCWNDWRYVKDHLGYEMACLCSALDVGQAGEWQSDARLYQALLLRAGFDIGEPDGQFGKRSQAAFKLAVKADKPGFGFTWGPDGVPKADPRDGVELANVLRKRLATGTWTKVTG